MGGVDSRSSSRRGGGRPHHDDRDGRGATQQSDEKQSAGTDSKTTGSGHDAHTEGEVEIGGIGSRRMELKVVVA